MFDGLPTTPELDFMDAVITRLSDERNWCHTGASSGGMARLCVHITIDFISKRRGELHGVFGPVANPVFSAVVRSAQALFPARADGSIISGFNDHPDTTHADVMRVLHRAREILASR